MDAQNATPALSGFDFYPLDSRDYSGLCSEWSGELGISLTQTNRIQKRMNDAPLQKAIELLESIQSLAEEIKSTHAARIIGVKAQDALEILAAMQDLSE